MGTGGDLYDVAGCVNGALHVLHVVDIDRRALTVFGFGAGAPGIAAHVLDGELFVALKDFLEDGLNLVSDGLVDLDGADGRGFLTAGHERPDLHLNLDHVRLSGCLIGVVAAARAEDLFHLLLDRTRDGNRRGHGQILVCAVLLSQFFALCVREVVLFGVVLHVGFGVILDGNRVGNHLGGLERFCIEGVQEAAGHDERLLTGGSALGLEQSDGLTGLFGVVRDGRLDALNNTGRQHGLGG